MKSGLNTLYFIVGASFTEPKKMEGGAATFSNGTIVA
jgi:hypothetical protein